MRLAIFNRTKRETIAPPRFTMPAASTAKKTRSYLFAIAVGTVLLWQVPFGGTLLYPFTLLATWFHEMGHGLMSMLLGADFERLVIFPDASGYAQSSWSSGTWGIAHALTAAAGLLGPALAGAAMIVASRSERVTRVALAALAVTLALSTLIWVRSWVGWVVLPGFAFAIAAVAASRRVALRRFVIEMLGVHAAISVWRDLGYLFSPGGAVGGRLSPSDTQAIADVLILPYWFWGGAISAAIAFVLWKALVVACRPERP
jgi:hypothetical protein